MSFKKLVCLCLFVIIGSLGTLSAPAAMAQGHAGVSTPLSEADKKEVTDLLSVYLLPAMTDTQQAMGVVASDPDKSCNLGKSAVNRIREFRRRLEELKDRFKSEGKDISPLENMLTKIDAMLLPGRNPEDIYCSAAEAMKKMTPEERAWANKVANNTSAYLARINAATDALVKNDKPQACSNLREAQKILLEMDEIIQSQRAKDQAAGKPVDGYDQLSITNQSNKQKTANMMAQACAAS